MAETLEQIYFNTALGATELNDGEHTIVTTDANTSYVIKDVMVKDNENLSANTYLELNGFNIGNLTGNSSGSLIVPPNSTLKIKTTDYPFSFVENKYFLKNTAGGIAVKYDYTVANGETSVYSFGGISGGANPPSSTSMVDAMYTASAGDGNPYIHYTSSDGNSSQGLHYARTDTTGTGTLNTQSYKACLISESSYYGRKVWNNDNGAMTYKDVVASPTNTGSFVNPGNIAGGAKTNSYSPYPSSSYPRGFFGHGFYFYIPNSAYSSAIQAINVNTGSFFRFNLSSANSLTSAYTGFSVSHNIFNDTLTIYRVYGSTSMYYDTIPVTKTVLDAVSNNSENNYTCSPSGTITLAASVDTSSYGVYGGDKYGNFVYKTAGHILRTINTAGSTVDEQSSLSLNGSTLTADSAGYPFTKRSRVLSTAEVATLGLSSPTLGVQILGVKSVV